jgi:iron complex transport system substrate-binding protein
MVSRRLGRAPQGERLAQSLAARQRKVLEARAAGPTPECVLLIWPDPPQAAGGGTFLADVLSEAGARNLLAGRPGWPLVSTEWLATTPIDVLVIPESRHTRGAYERAMASGPLSRGTVARARVVRIDESTLTRPGPRVFDALERLARELAK